MCMCSSKTCFPCPSPFPTFLFCPGHQGCMANSAWLGLQKKDSFKVSCMRLYQTRERLKQVSTAVLQVWDGLVWTASKDPWGMGGCGDQTVTWQSRYQKKYCMYQSNIVAFLFPISTLLHLPSRNLSFPR